MRSLFDIPLFWRILYEVTPYADGFYFPGWLLMWIMELVNGRMIIDPGIKTILTVIAGGRRNLGRTPQAN